MRKLPTRWSRSSRDLRSRKFAKPICAASWYKASVRRDTDHAYYCTRAMPNSGFSCGDICHPTDQPNGTTKNDSSPA